MQRRALLALVWGWLVGGRVDGATRCLCPPSLPAPVDAHLVPLPTAASPNASKLTPRLLRRFRVRHGAVGRWHAAMCRAAAGEPLRVLVFGTSVTQGNCCQDCCAPASGGDDGACLQPLPSGAYYASDRECAWPGRLERWLRRAYPRANVTVSNLAVGGTDVRYFASVVGDYARSGADVVFVENMNARWAMFASSDGERSVLSASERFAREVLSWDGGRTALLFVHMFQRDVLALAPQTDKDTAKRCAPPRRACVRGARRGVPVSRVGGGEVSGGRRVGFARASERSVAPRNNRFRIVPPR